MMRTLFLTKVNIMRRLLLAVILLAAFTMVFAVTARPSHAVTLEGEYTLMNEYSPGITELPAELKETQFDLYKVGYFVVGDPYVRLYETYEDMGVVLPLKADQSDNVVWTKKWLECAQTLYNNIKTMQNPPASDKIDVAADGTFTKTDLDNGLYLLAGKSQKVDNYPESGDQSYWWPQPMLISVLNSDAKVNVKPMTGMIHHLKVKKDWQWPDGMSEDVKDLVSPETIKLELYYGPKLKKTVTLPDQDGHWYYSWDTAEDEGDPNNWSVKEVFDDEEEFLKNFQVITVGKFLPGAENSEDSGEEVLTITNKYDRRTLQITKTLKDGYVNNGEGNSISLVFELSGFKGEDRIYHKYVGMQFDGSSDTQTLPVKDIPIGLTELKVKEVSGSNYTPDAEEKTADGPDKNGIYTVSFDNSLSNQIHNSGVINKFKITKDGYEFDKRLGISE